MADERLSPRQVLAGVIAGRDIIQIGYVHGDVKLVVEREVYRLGPWPPHGDVPGAREQPSRLLAAQHAVVPFDAERRREEVDQLTAWRDGDGRGLSVMLVHGPGGQGKTRLADYFADRSRRTGWRVVAARPGGAAGTAGTLASADRTERRGRAKDVPGLLVVVDYAERWRAEDLQALVDDLLLMRIPVRLLLLARPAGIWWSALAHELQTRNVRAEVLRLPGLAARPADRNAVFVAARDAFAAALGVRKPQKIKPPPLVDEQFDLVLTVHMAALVAVHEQYLRQSAQPVDGRWRAAADPVALAEYLLNREQGYWERAQATGAVAIPAHTMAAATYVATLTRPLPYRDGVAVLRRTGLAGDQETAGTVLRDHAVCYPPATASASTVLEPLYPDRLGEDFLALQTPLLPETESRMYRDLDPWAEHGYQANPWADTALTTLLNPGEQDAYPAYARSVITVMIETARRWPHMARQRLYPLLRTHPKVMLLAGSAALSALAGLEDPQEDTGIIRVLEAVEAVLPRHKHIDLDVGAAAVTERLVNHRLREATGRAERAALHAKLSWRYSNAGRHQDALRSSEEAVALRRRLAQADRDGHLPDLAASLTSLADRLAQLGRHIDALEAAEEAVAGYRELIVFSPTYLPELVAALAGLGDRLAQSDRPQDALAPTREAVEQYRDLVQVNPGAYLPRLAGSLIGLSALSSRLGRREEALEAVDEAVAIYRKLVETDHGRYRSDLAAALTSRGVGLARLRRWEDALAATEAAVKRYRELAQLIPATYLPHLTECLYHVSNILSWGLDRRTDAIAYAEEAQELSPQLAQIPFAYRPDLATSAAKLDIRWLDQYKSVAGIRNSWTTDRRRLPDEHETVALRVAELVDSCVRRYGLLTKKQQQLIIDNGYLDELIAQGRTDELEEWVRDAVELRKLGYQVNREGGFRLMQRIAERAHALSQIRNAVREIEGYWDKIGDWRR